MIIENPEALKSWLTAVLAPLCDADPAALSKYVLALAKKEKPESELRSAMCDQLDVFLQQETKGFVDKLFHTLETKSYLQSNPEPPGRPAEDTTPSVPATSIPAVVPPSSSTDEAKHLTSDTGATRSEQPRESSRTSSKVPPTTTRSSDRSRRRSWSPRSRSRSRSRERRAQRSRSRDRSSRDHRGGRGGYDADRRSRRSPVSSSRRNSDRNRARSRSPGGRRSRSPRNSTSSRRPRSPLPTKSAASDQVAAGDGHGADTPSGPAVQSVVVAPAANLPSSGPTNKFRCRDYDEKGYCMRGDLCPYDHGADPVVLEDVELNSMLNYNRPPPNAVVVVTGPPQVAPAVAGAVVPPPVVGAPHLRGPPPSLPPSGEPYNPDAPGISWPPPPPHHMVGPPGIVPLRGSGGYRGGPPPPMAFGHHHHRLPPPHLRGHMRGHGPPHLGPPPGLHTRGHGGPPPMGLLGAAPHPSGPAAGQRELISVPTAGMGGLADDGESIGTGMKRSINDAGMDDGQALKRSHFDYNRLGAQTGPNQQGQQQPPPQRRAFDPTNCCLEVKKIPRGLNNISVLNNHFSKFGKIVNLQVSFNGDPEGALVTFSSHSEAQAAYRSTEAVLNNRFIKVFWHNKESPEKQENVPPSAKMPVKERLGGLGGRPVLTQSQAAAPAILDDAAVKEATEAKEKEREKAVAAIKRSQEILAAKEALKKKQEEQKREATKLQVDLQRRKQELLDKQLQQQRILIERLEKGKTGGLKPEERAQVMQTVRNLQESIEKLKRDLQLHTAKEPVVPTNKTVTAAAVVTAKSVEEAKKEKLDAEIELYQKQMEGSDTTELQRRLQELNTIISQSHRGHPSAIRRGGIRGVRSAVALRGSRGRAGALAGSRGASRGRGRGGYFAAPHVSVDRRPTQLKATGFDASQQGDILAHFANFGEVVDYQVDEAVPSLIIRYKARKDAEMALAQAAKTFLGTPNLQVQWHALPGSAGQKVKLGEVGEEDGGVVGVEATGEGEPAVGEEAEDEEEENEGLDDLLNYEEDDEDEERSWRR